jgi:ABC-type enterochelin transport system substrate-binding protein
LRKSNNTDANRLHSLGMAVENTQQAAENEIVRAVRGAGREDVTTLPPSSVATSAANERGSTARP